MRVVLDGIRAPGWPEKVGAIRDPDTAEFPTIVVRGDGVEDLKLFVEGSPKLVSLVGTARRG